MSISFTPFHNPVQLTTTKTSAKFVKNSIADMTSTYYHGVLRQIRQSQNKLDANSRTIASDAHRAWKKNMGNKIQAICPKYTYKTPMEMRSWKPVPPSCTDANRMMIGDKFGNGGIFCSTEANDQDKKECREKLRKLYELDKIPMVYSAEQSDKIRQNYENSNTLTKFLKKFQHNVGEVGYIVEKNPLFGGKV